MHQSLTAIFTCVALLATQSSCLTPAEYALTNHPPAADDVTAIQQTLALFPLAIDLKQFDLLDAVFAPDAVANFTGHSVSVGLPAIKTYLSAGLAGLASQHNLGTLYINQTGSDTATSYNWLQGTFFGTGVAANRSYSDFGYYQDDVVKSQGRWLVKKRVFGTFVSGVFFLLRASLAPRSSQSSIKDAFDGIG